MNIFMEKFLDEVDLTRFRNADFENDWNALVPVVAKMIVSERKHDPIERALLIGLRDSYSSFSIETTFKKVTDILDHRYNKSVLIVENYKGRVFKHQDGVVLSVKLNGIFLTNSKYVGNEVGNIKKAIDEHKLL